jgi:hypothetical protein
MLIEPERLRRAERMGGRAMRVLVATRELQGAVAGDFAWGVDGELVTGVAEECDAGDACGCRRSWVGLGSSRATTTAMVVDRPAIGEAVLREAVEDWLDRSGWADLVRQASEAGEYSVDGEVGDDPDVVVAELIYEHVEVIERVCDSFPVGTVVVRHGDCVFARAIPDAA